MFEMFLMSAPESWQLSAWTTVSFLVRWHVERCCVCPPDPPLLPPTPLPHPPSPPQHSPSPHRPPPLPNSDLIHPDDLLTKGSKSRDKGRDRRGPKDRKKAGHVMEGPEKRGPRPRVDELLVGALRAPLTLHLRAVLHCLWVLSYVFRCWPTSQHIMCSSQCFTECFRMEGISCSLRIKQ